MSEEIEAAPMCFACGQQNPIGLKIHFDFDGEVCTAEFTPNENHVGFQDTTKITLVFRTRYMAGSSTRPWTM